ncbi:gluconolactonase [Saccharobesus litoralis]|uniref:Gluconolactonase n=1 Tax=Saccharobesus litoralis TaxID=2172099 RepID=A0A2S0VNT0_9ALTE|nr:SMP-30/gluconolactonase/LRE family protein [Saccharobesus litoralis]AWB65868.1 gluconolactonase [Saccharobesus litoralis]
MSYSIDDIAFTAEHLVRPECVLATRAGHLYVADFRGGVSHITPTGEQYFYGGGDVAGYGQLKPNGIALLADGSFLVAHLGDEKGGVFRVYRDNRIEPYVTHIAGEHLPPSNFIYLDKQGRLWLTVSTRHTPRAAAYRSDIKDGFIAVIEDGQARIVADNIGYTNEVFVTPDGMQLYVNATFSRELLRYDITADNQLENAKVISQFEAGVYPDGLTMDSQGYLWIVSIVSNRLIRLNPATGQYQIMLQDVDIDHLNWVEQAYQQHAMGRPHLDQVKAKRLSNISSLAFSGENLSRMVFGCLLGAKLAYIDTEFSGIAPAHWHFDD